MNKTQLIETIAETNKMSKKQAGDVLTTVIEGIQTGVRKDGEVRLVGFGTFKKAVRKARKGVNPATGEKIKIAKKTYPKFVPSKTWIPTRKVAAKTKK